MELVEGESLAARDRARTASHAEVMRGCEIATRSTARTGGRGPRD